MVEGEETFMQDKKTRTEIVGWAGSPDMFQGEGCTAATGLPKGELAVPGVSNGQRQENAFMEKLSQADGNVNFPEEGNMFSGIKASGEGSGHVG